MDAFVTRVSQKRPAEESKENAETERTAPINPAVGELATALEELARTSSSLSSGATWHAEALKFARENLQNAIAVKAFATLIKQIDQVQTKQNVETEEKKEKKEVVGAKSEPVASVPATAVAPVTTAVSVPSAPSAPAASAPAASTAAPALNAAPAAAAVAPTPAAGPIAPASELLLTIPDVSFLVPKGKFTLQLTHRTFYLTNPAQPAKNLSFELSDIDLLFDLPDINKRDWLVVAQLKKEKELTVGKKAYPAVVMKMLATDKVKDKHFVLNKSNSDAAVSSMASIASGAGFIGSKLNVTMLSLIKCIPALKDTQVVAGESHIFDSLKKLPCVNCKNEVEDGALYFLRTGLLFIKPTIYIPIANIDGITPARGMSSTFDMRVGIAGSKKEIAFIMIEPKEEGAITKYCQFLGQEQARLEKAEKNKKMGLPPPAPSTLSAPAPAAATTPAASADSDAPAILSHGSDDIAASNVISAPRSSRASRPRSFAGMDDGEDDKPKKSSEGEEGEGNDNEEDEDADEDEEGEGDDSDDENSSDDEEWSDGSDSSSDDSAEYDSDKDAEEITSEDEREREKRKQREREEEGDEEEDADEEEEEEDETAKAPVKDETGDVKMSSSSAPSAQPATTAATAEDPIILDADDDDDMQQ